MPFAPKLKGSAEALAALEAFLETIPYDFVLWRLVEPGDPGSLRMDYTAHMVAKSTGVDLSDSIGMCMKDTFPDYAESHMMDPYVEALRTGEPQEMPRIRYGDERIPETEFRMICYPVAEDLVGVLVEDVTARVRAEMEREMALEELGIQAKELERSNQNLEEFAYVASHDLKSPLRDIEHLATWIFEDAGELLPERSRTHLERLRDRVRRMQQLLNDLLEYSRAGQVFEEVREIDSTKLLQNARELIFVPEGFTVSLPDDAPRIQTPKAPLEQVFMNLMGNAIKHHNRPDGRVDVTWSDAGDFVEFVVADDGPGIPSKFQTRVFRLFTTLRPRDEVEGSGMGLAMVKKLVETYGGEITLESQEGKGCKFRFTWPKNWKRVTPSGTKE